MQEPRRYPSGPPAVLSVAARDDGYEIEALFRRQPTCQLRLPLDDFAHFSDDGAPAGICRPSPELVINHPVYQIRAFQKVPPRR